VRLIADPIASLLCGRAVVTEAVGLDHEPEIRPVEVDPESINPLLGKRAR
jgi:hypothetical protein